LPNVLLPVLGAVLAVLASHTGWVGVPDPSQAVTLLATVSVLAGTALTYAEVVHELPTIRREYRIGVSGLQVIVAKLTAAIALLIPMTALLVIFYALLRPVGGATKLTVVPAIVGLLFPLFMAGVASAAAGLVVSAASPHLQRAVGLSTALAIMQVALNGTLIPLGPAGRMISILVPARLAVAAQRAFLGGASGHASHDALWKHQASTWAIDLLLLAVLCVLFTVAAGAVLDRRCRTPE
jgi:hypothetical protein